MSNQTTSTSVTRRTKSKVKPIKNQPALGLFIEECQKAGIFKNLSKISDSKNKKTSTNKRQRQPTGSSTQTAEKKKKAGDPLDDAQPPPSDKGYLDLCDNMAGIDLLQELKKHGTDNYCYSKKRQRKRNQKHGGKDDYEPKTHH